MKGKAANRETLTMTPNDAAAPYRTAYPAKPMKRPANNDDELRLMKARDGLNELPASPAPDAAFQRHSSLPDSKAAAEEARHLWVIRLEDFPVALEKCPWGASLESKEIKHSNLTGGASAHSGGEIWFIGDDQVVVNASSGRYGAGSQAEFDHIVNALRRAGYTVASTGFDADSLTIPNAILVGDPEWQEPL